MKTIMIIASRPASGQTTVTVNLAAAFSRRGYRMLIGDSGKNEKLRRWLGIDKEESVAKEEVIVGGGLRAHILNTRLGIELLELFLTPEDSAAADITAYLDKLGYDYLLLMPASAEECPQLTAISDALIVCSDLAAADELEILKKVEKLWQNSRTDASGIDLIIPNKINTKEWEHNVRQLSLLGDYFGYERIADPLPT